MSVASLLLGIGVGAALSPTTQAREPINPTAIRVSEWLGSDGSTVLAPTVNPNIHTLAPGAAIIASGEITFGRPADGLWPTEAPVSIMIAPVPGADHWVRFLTDSQWQQGAYTLPQALGTRGFSCRPADPDFVWLQAYWHVADERWVVELATGVSAYRSDVLHELGLVLESPGDDRAVIQTPESLIINEITPLLTCGPEVALDISGADVTAIATLARAVGQFPGGVLTGQVINIGKEGVEPNEDAYLITEVSLQVGAHAEGDMIVTLSSFHLNPAVAAPIQQTSGATQVIAQPDAELILGTVSSGGTLTVNTLTLARAAPNHLAGRGIPMFGPRWRSVIGVYAPTGLGGQEIPITLVGVKVRNILGAHRDLKAQIWTTGETGV